jgi:aspartate racemase
LHRAFDLVVSSVPWLHIADAVETEARRRNYRRVGLLGTRPVMESTVYRARFEKGQIGITLPTVSERVELDTIIRTQLIRGEYTLRSRERVEEIIARMAAGGVEAVILGCTELPLLVTKERSALPLLDSTRLLAAAALTRSSSLASISY